VVLVQSQKVMLAKLKKVMMRGRRRRKMVPCHTHWLQPLTSILMTFQQYHRTAFCSELDLQTSGVW
jgi:hypothetical protein